MIHLVQGSAAPGTWSPSCCCGTGRQGSTTDHAAIASLLERFKSHTKALNALLEWFSGLRAMFGGREIPPFIQARINEV